MPGYRHDRGSLRHLRGRRQRIYDPIQSEDPKVSYPLDFYATNLGATLNAFAGGVAGVSGPTGWECPANPIIPPSDFQVTLYSESSLNGGKVISGGFDSSNNPIAMNYDPANPTSTFNARSTFYLANTATGDFNVPVNAYITPTIHSFNLNADGTTQGGVPPIGYGAAPIAGSTAGTESCPTSVPIPAGYTWVKVWLFRAGLPTRKFITSSIFQEVGNISCNPGNYPNYNAGTGQLTQLKNTLTFLSAIVMEGALARAILSIHRQAPTGLVSREIEGTLMCVNPTAGGTTSTGMPYGSTTAVLTGAYSVLAPLPALGSDSWTDVAGYAPNACAAVGTTAIDPLGICKATQLPIDNSPTTQDIDDPANPRFDFLFVVSPQTVMTKDMSNTGSLTYQQYAPYRFRTNSDCMANDPDTAGCNASNALTMYGVKFYDVGTAGDVPSTGGTECSPSARCSPRIDPELPKTRIDMTMERKGKSKTERKSAAYASILWVAALVAAA